MNVPLEELNAWACHSFRVNGFLLKAVVALQTGQEQNALSHLWDAQKHTARLLNALEQAGADDPAHSPEAGCLPASIGETRGGCEIPLELLSSPAAKRYAQALREVANACREMEQERGIVDGLTEMFEDYAESAELEVFGPVGLEG